MMQFLYSLLVVFILRPHADGVLGLKRRGTGASADGIDRQPGAPRTCRCAPDQWEGTLNTVEREFDWAARGALDRETNTRVHYDYVHRLFATVEVETGVKSVVDHRKGLRYVIEKDGTCHVTANNQAMVRMCLPETAYVVNEYQIGPSTPVKVWQATLLGNVTMRTTVMTKQCMPLSEETFMEDNEYASLTSSMYVNITFGIRTPGVFAPPKGCIKRHEHEIYKEFD